MRVKSFKKANWQKHSLPVMYILNCIDLQKGRP